MRKGLHLTDAIIARLPVPSRRMETVDLGARNLVLVCHPSGRKTWSWLGRMDGRPYRATLGPFPTYNVEAAHRWAEDIGNHREHGINIAAIRKEAATREKRQKLQREAWTYPPCRSYSTGPIKPSRNARAACHSRRTV